MTQRICVDCGEPFEIETQYFDLYIEERQERCDDCWYEWDEREHGFSVYGLAPHHHNIYITGSIIGSTVMNDYSDSKRDEDGRYWIEEADMWFTPDEEMDGHMGLWEER